MLVLPGKSANVQSPCRGGDGCVEGCGRAVARGPWRRTAGLIAAVGICIVSGSGSCAASSGQAPVTRATAVRAVLAFIVLALSVTFVLTQSPRLGPDLRGGTRIHRANPDSRRAAEVLGRTAQLTFHPVLGFPCGTRCQYLLPAG
jgi:hypothetical protein